MKQTADNLPQPVIIKNVDTNASGECLGEAKDPMGQYTYADYLDGNHCHIEYKVVAETAGVYRLDIYTASANNLRYIYAKVNDGLPAILKPEGSGGWGWANATSRSSMLVDLKEGDNKLTLEQAPVYIKGQRQAYFFPNIYKFEFTKIDDTAAPAKEYSIFQEAEEGFEGDAVVDSRVGSHNDKAIGLDNGRTAIYTVNADKEGVYLMRIWYAQWNSTRHLSIEVEGYAVNELTVNDNGSSWNVAHNNILVPVYLEKGDNKVTLKGFSGNAPIVDCMVFEAVDAPWYEIQKIEKNPDTYTVLAKEYENESALFNLTLTTDCVGDKEGRSALGYSDYEADNTNIGAKYTIRNVQKAGVYTMTVYTACADERNFYVRLNDNKGVILKCANNGTWEKDLASCTGETSAKVWLKEGDNTLVLARFKQDHMPGIGKFVFTEDLFSDLKESDFAGFKAVVEAENNYHGIESTAKNYSKGEGDRQYGISLTDGKTDAAAYYTVNVDKAGTYLMRLWHSDFNGTRNNYIGVRGFEDVLTTPTPGSNDWNELATGIGSAVVNLNEGLNYFVVKHGTTDAHASYDCYEFELIDGIAGPGIAESDESLATASGLCTLALDGLDGEITNVDDNEYNHAILTATKDEPAVTLSFENPLNVTRVSYASATPGKDKWTLDIVDDQWTPMDVKSFGLLHSYVCENSQTPANKVTLSLVGVKSGDKVSLGHFDVVGTKAMPTSVDDVVADFPELNVVNGTLYFNAEGKEYAVYSVSGVLVASGTAGSDTVAVNLDNGLYIVKIGGKAVKVIVK